MGALLGERRSRRAALGLVAALTRMPGGRWVVAGLGHTTPPPQAGAVVAGVKCATRVGASVGLEVARDAVSALPALGAGLVEVGPVSRSEVGLALEVLKRSRGPVALRVGASDAVEVARAIGAHASLVVVDVSDGHALLAQVRAVVSVPVVARNTVMAITESPSPAQAVALMVEGAEAVLATPAALVEAGPGWFHRTTIAYLARFRRGDAPAAPRSSVGWMAGLGLGLGMIAGGVGATMVALGPVILPYDRAFLGAAASDLATVNPRLIHFLQHDRITLAGTMGALGILYAALSWWGIREGRAWARDAILASGLVGFPTLFYFFAYQYVEPVHVALAAVLFPLFVLATWRRPHPVIDADESEAPPDEWRRALMGQLVMVATGAGLIIGGLTISYVGLTAVFVPADLGYMNTSAHTLAAANDRLVSFIAHDRAGFGGALISVGVLVLLISAWGWRRGQPWVWWSLAAAATVGFGAALAIHIAVGYLDFVHLAPIYAGTAATAIGLALSGPFLLARSPTVETATAGQAGHASAVAVAPPR
jgi:hypothetical protein